jgi:glycoprotein endo-alpha-1,2-mannosidase
MKWIARAGVGVVIVSWWGPGSYEDQQVWDILDIADDYDLKVAFYVEPHSGGYIRYDSQNNSTLGTRTPFDVKEDVMYIIDTYGCHRALYRKNGRPVLLFFAARSYQNGRQADWKTVWDQLHSEHQYNPVVIAHDTNLNRRIIAGGWDGGHDYGCESALATSSRWKSLAEQYNEKNKILYFTVCPGYDKSRILGGAGDNILDREDGELYQRLWERAMVSKSSTSNHVVITSFNEYHEGSSIEPVVPKSTEDYELDGKNISSYTYQDYEGAWGRHGSRAVFAYIEWSKKLADLYLQA